MYERILVPMDGSELSERVLPYAKILGKRLDSEVIVFSTCLEGQRSEHLLRVYLDKQAEELRSFGVKAIPVVTYGDAADEILDFSEENDIGLIIMSTHGHTGVSRWIIGSVSNKVIHESYVPLLLIKTGAVPAVCKADGNWKILVPLDGSEFSEASLPYAAGIARESGSEIVLLRVNEAMRLPSYVNPEPDPGCEGYREQYMIRMEDEIQNYLDGMKEELQSQGLNICSEVVAGRVAEEIIKYAESHDISLIALTTQGFSGFSQWAFGSVANKVVQGISKPTLLLRPKPKILEI